MNPADAAKAFDVPGRLVTVEPLGSGNVNDTFCAVFRTTFDEHRFVLQRINHAVFKSPETVMANMRAVTEHAHRRIEAAADEADRIWQLPRIIPARDGRDLFEAPDGSYWRGLSLIASAKSHDRVHSPEHAFEAGRVLGHFHHLIADFPVANLADTLPGFHVTPDYLRAFDEIRATPGGERLLTASAESQRIARFIEDRRSFVPVLENAAASRELSIRPIHGDPKITNIMIDDVTGRGTAIIDLDTVKPGLIHYDVGDAARSACNPAGEETQDLDEVYFDLDLFDALMRGYLREASGFLSPTDHRFLYDAVRLIAFELGLRFYTDYLAGNRYFKVRHELQNLHRARVQMKLCESIEARESQIRQILT